MDRPCYSQNAWWTFAKENPLWRTSSRKTLPWWSEEAIQGHLQSLPSGLQHTNRVMGTDCTRSYKVARPHKKGSWWIRSKKKKKKKKSAKLSRNVHSGKPELKHHQQSFLPHISLVLSATGRLELRLVSSAILEHTNNNTSHSWLGLVIVSNDRRTCRIASSSRFWWVHSTYYYNIEDWKDTPKLYSFAFWPSVMINPQWIELPMSRTNFHGPRDVRAI